MLHFAGRKAISIHALREEGDVRPAGRGGGRDAISIHALREEGDQFDHFLTMHQKNFYPRPPRGGRPPINESSFTKSFISIHALREEGDPPTPPSSRSTIYFYPRPPRGGRHKRQGN